MFENWQEDTNRTDRPVPIVVIVVLVALALTVGMSWSPEAVEGPPAYGALLLD